MPGAHRNAVGLRDSEEEEGGSHSALVVALWSVQRWWFHDITPLHTPEGPFGGIPAGPLTQTSEIPRSPVSREAALIHATLQERLWSFYTHVWIFSGTYGTSAPQLELQMFKLHERTIIVLE